MPDGQNQVTIILSEVNGGRYFNEFDMGSRQNELKTKPAVTIKSRLNNWIDLEKISCASASLRELGVKEIHLYTPYFLGARSDRKFEEGGNNYLKDVICPVINSLGFESVTVIDPHSDVLEGCLKNFKKESNLRLVNHFMAEIAVEKGISALDVKKGFILISPDAGAEKKIHKLAEAIGYEGEIITCSKSRDTEGKLTKTEVPLKDEYLDKDFIIIDDICDGGRTFVNIAKELQYPCGKKHRSKIYLVVTHGIFSAGFSELSKYFDGIYCTNSYQHVGPSANNSSLIEFGENKEMVPGIAGFKVKSLNVF